jgi:exonuclease III
MLMMNTSSSIFVWNCRGAANTSFYRFCKQYITTNKPAMLVIMETRCDPTKLYRTFELLGYDDFTAANCQGYAGGIAIAWKKDYITVDVCIEKF